MEILEIVLQVLLELIGNGLIEGLLELPFSEYKDRRDRKNHHPVLASLGYLLMGAAFGAFFAWVWPQRLLPFGGLPGASLLLSPLGAGALMEAWGRFRRSRGHETTNLATWFGGAAFAFGAAMARYLMVA